jgi:hypothetical protein
MREIRGRKSLSKISTWGSGINLPREISLSSFSLGFLPESVQQSTVHAQEISYRNQKRNYIS